MEGIIESLPQVAVNAGVFVGMIIATLAGVKFAKKTKEDPVTPEGAQVLVGGLLQDNVTSIMLQEAQKLLTHVVERNTDQLRDVHNELVRLNKNLERIEGLVK